MTVSVTKSTFLAEPVSKASLPSAHVGSVFAAVDLCAILMSGVIANTVFVADGPGWVRHLAAAGLYAVVLVLLRQTAGAYSRVSLRKISGGIGDTLTVPLSAALLMAGVGTALEMQNHFSPSWFLALVLATPLVLVTARLVARGVVFVLARRSLVGRNVAIVGGTEHGVRLIRSLRPRMEPWTRVVGVFDDRLERLPQRVGRYPVMGNLDDLIVFARMHRVDEILVALPWSAEQRLLDILGKLKVIPANIRLAPDGIGLHFLDRDFERFERLPVFNIYKRPISGWGAVAKSVEDKILGSLALLILAPVMALCAAAIRLDSPGPILFRQKRYGFNNQLIEVFKFRTMHVAQCDANAEKLTEKNDPRVTRVGRFLRKSSLDELPQLFNVLRGEMSMVGPRPHATKAKAAGKLYAEVVEEYAVRHKIKPGITGWAQVNGWRGETDTEEKIRRRVECDLYYMENWSLLLDLKVLLRTVLVFIKPQNAY